MRRAAPSILAERLAETGFAIRSIDPATGGVVATAGLVTLEDGRRVFAKTLPDVGDDIFVVEASGLQDLRRLGGVRTPTVLCVTGHLLVLEQLRPRPDADAGFWERLGQTVARLHTSTVAERFGWHRDGWLGRLRQHNGWSDDGHAFFAQYRILRWLTEPLVEAAFDREDRAALERLCVALPDLVPAQRPCLTHGDLWRENILADDDGCPALIDPAASYTWAEVDLSMLWSTPRPAAADRFFGAYAEHAPLAPGWKDRMPVLHLRELLCVIAHGDDDWGAANLVRKTIAPHRHRSTGEGGL